MTDSSPKRWPDRLNSLLRRVTSSGRFMPEIDGLRFIAIMCVVALHAEYLVRADRGQPDVSSWNNAAFSSIFRSGWVGVYLFFAISGFVLGLPFAEQYLANGKPIKLKQYYTRRVLRIEPPYLINLAALFFLMLLAHGTQRLSLTPNFLANAVYAHNLAFNEWSAINFVAWSLEVEAQFYLLAPFLARAFFSVAGKRPRRAAIITSMLVCGAASVFAVDLPYGIRNLLLFHLQFFLAGFMLADLFVSDWKTQSRRTMFHDLMATAAFIGVFAAATHKLWPVIVPLLILFAYIGMLRGRFWLAALTNRWIAVIGGMCYTIHLYHFWVWRPVRALMLPITGNLPYWGEVLAEFLLCAPIMVAACSVLFLLFEKPFMHRDWPARLRSMLTGRQAHDQGTSVVKIDSIEHPAEQQRQRIGSVR